MFRIENLTSGYGGITAIRDIDCHINKGEIVALIGANGAGKSTLLKTISGYIKAKNGSIFLHNKNITNIPMHKIVRCGIAQSPEGRKVFATLTVRDNLLMGAYCRKKINKDQLNFIYSTFPRLAEREKQLAGTLSGGEQQMLAIGRALMAEPELLLLDEPSLGLAPATTKELFVLIDKVNKVQEISIFLVEQNASIALKYADRGYVLEAGKIVLSGSNTELLNSKVVQEAYLGNKH